MRENSNPAESVSGNRGDKYGHIALSQQVCRSGGSEHGISSEKLDLH